MIFSQAPGWPAVSLMVDDEEAPGLGKSSNWENHNLDYFCHDYPSEGKVKSSLKLGPVGFNQGNGENQFDKKTAKYFH